MKKIITTAGLAVLGAATMNAQNAPGLTSLERSKPWSVSAVLRGFYDDNYVTRSKELEQDSYGVEISPGVGFNWVKDRTYLGLSYVYSMKYYEDRRNNRADHSHQFNFKLNQAFSERHKLDLSDSLVIAQEPTIIEPVGPVSVPLRTEGDVLRNAAIGAFTMELTRLFSMVLGYSNTLYDYEETGAGRRSAVLDRMEHLAWLNFRWHALPTTVGVFGYQFGYNDYTSNESLDASTGFFNPLTGRVFPFVDPDIRDNYTHYFFVGADHTFNPNFMTSVRVGGQYTDYRNLDEAEWAPYADASATWTYNPGSYVQVGVRHARNATDVAFSGGGQITPTLDQESTTLYSTVVHRITAKLRFSAFGQWQNSDFEGGVVDGLTDNYFLAGLNFTYQFNPHWAAETGYNYDRLDSDIGGRSFTRNRVYVGVRATY